ncbi:helix-turn-helix domain-containing protein [Niallia sp. 01092]|uniref:helix-turn-helix domain-containing protein n=1 Tax=unclassified Niallia TaxID=2837522 RepID=UPI003FD4B81C
MVEIRNIRTFYYAATTLNFSEAAKQMNYTQPAVTLQIKKWKRSLVVNFSNRLVSIKS